VYVSAWQKSSYSNEGVNCVNVAADPNGSIRIRESDAPHVMLATTRAGLRDLLAAIKADRLPGGSES
jgi:Domain of unknown function (DUF397)